VTTVFENSADAFCFGYNKLHYPQQLLIQAGP